MLAVPAALSFIVTIDGPAGTGKSTVANSLAKRLGLEFLEFTLADVGRDVVVGVVAAIGADQAVAAAL